MCIVLRHAYIHTHTQYMECLSFNLCPFREIYSRFSLGRVEGVLTSAQACKQNNVSQNWKRSVLIPVLKKDNVKECSNHCTVALISHASKVILKILAARLQQYMNNELQNVQAGCRKDRGNRSHCQDPLDHS